VVTLEQVHLDRSKGTGLDFGIRDGYSWKGYYIKKYHIFDPKTGNIIISNIEHLKEKNNEEIESLELGSDIQSVEFMTGIPNCDLIRKRKPILKSADIFYIPSGDKIKTRNYLGSKRRSFTHGEKLVCEIYLPSTLFKKIVKIRNKVDKFPTFKGIFEQHKIYYRNFVFTIKSNYQIKNLDKNKEFLKDWKSVTRGSRWGEPLVTENLKDTILQDMRNFIKKYENFEVEN